MTAEASTLEAEATGTIKWMTFFILTPLQIKILARRAYRETYLNVPTWASLRLSFTTGRAHDEADNIGEASLKFL